MKQYPSRLKFKKYHKVNFSFNSLKEQKSFIPTKGMLALKAITAGKLNFRQLEAGRRAMRRTTKKMGKIFIKVFPYASYTSKPVSSRMGKGKGTHDIWLVPIRKGQIIFEIAGSNSKLLEKALIQARNKLPIVTKVVSLQY